MIGFFYLMFCTLVFQVGYYNTRAEVNNYTVVWAILLGCAFICYTISMASKDIRNK
jgi:hypothetical protein